MPEDLVKFGLIPEFIGRLPVISILEELTRSQLVCVLEQTKNSLLKQYRKMFLLEGAELRFTREAITEIAEQALTMKTGARALRSIMESVMLDVMYDLPAMDEPVEVVINAGVIRGKSKAKIVRTQPKKPQCCVIGIQIFRIDHTVSLIIFRTIVPSGFGHM